MAKLDELYHLCQFDASFNCVNGCVRRWEEYPRRAKFFTEAHQSSRGYCGRCAGDAQRRGLLSRLQCFPCCFCGNEGDAFFSLDLERRSCRFCLLCRPLLLWRYLKQNQVGPVGGAGQYGPLTRGTTARPVVVLWLNVPSLVDALLFDHTYQAPADGGAR